MPPLRLSRCAPSHLRTMIFTRSAPSYGERAAEPLPAYVGCRWSESFQHKSRFGASALCGKCVNKWACGRHATARAEARNTKASARARDQNATGRKPVPPQNDMHKHG